VAVGADPQRLALLDNFCWGDPRRPETLGSLVEAARGCYDAALHYRTPFISGKDSLNNEYLGADGLRHAIPPTLLISAIGLIWDVSQAITMDLKEAGNVVYLLGGLHPDAGLASGLVGYAPALYQALHQAIRQGLVRACHDLSEGGLAVAAAEMCIGGRLGLALEIPYPSQALFAAANACLLAEIRPGQCSAFETLLAGLPHERLGQVTAEPRLVVEFSSPAQAENTRAGISLPVSALVAAWKSNLGKPG